MIRMGYAIVCLNYYLQSTYTASYHLHSCFRTYNISSILTIYIMRMLEKLKIELIHVATSSIQALKMYIYIVNVADVIII